MQGNNTSATATNEKGILAKLQYLQDGIESESRAIEELTARLSDILKPDNSILAPPSVNGALQLEANIKTSSNLQDRIDYIQSKSRHNFKLIGDLISRIDL